MDKVVVTYGAATLHRDANRELWGISKDNKEVRSERTYTAEEYANRPDLQFMVEYGSMKATTVSPVVEKTVDSKPPVGTPATDKPVGDSAITQSTDSKPATATPAVTGTTGAVQK